MPKNKPGRSPRRYARVNAAAAYLDVHPVTIRKMIEDGKIHAYRSGQRLLRVDLDDVDALMAGDDTGVATTTPNSSFGGGVEGSRPPFGDP